MQSRKPYVTIPREIIELENVDDIRIPIYVYFYCRRPLIDIVGFSIDKLAACCGYKPNSHKNMINDKCKDVLNHFVNNDLFSEYPDDFSAFKHDQYIEVALNYEWFSPKTTYAYIEIEEIDKILNFKNTISSSNKITSSKLLLLLAYIRVNKLTRTKIQSESHPENKPEIFYKHYKVIAEDLNLSEDTIVVATDILCKLDIIATKEIPRYQDDSGNWHTDVTLFADKKEGWENELIWGEAHIKSSKKKKYNQNV